MKSTSCKLLVAAVGGFAGTSGASAANIDLVLSQPSSSDWTKASDTAGSAAFWSDGLAPQSGNAYHVGNDAGKTLRTPTGTNATFPGDSLTLHPTGQLLLKGSTTVTRVYTINNLILNGGSITHGTDNSTIGVAGTISIVANSAISNNSNNPRNIILSAALSGSAGLTTNIGNDDRLDLTSIASTFTGPWTFTGSAGGRVNAIGLNSLGSGNITIDTGATLDVDYDILSPTAALALNGVMVLDQNHTFASASVAGNPLSPGLHTYAELNSAFDAQFADGGSGSITVVPEPSVLGLSAAVGLLAVRRRRR